MKAINGFKTKIKQENNGRQHLQNITTAAILSALSLVLMVLVRFPVFPSATFYEMEFADVPILICSALLGPWYSLASLLTVCIIQTLTVSASSGFIGFLMHFLSSGLMILTMHFCKKHVKGIAGIIISALTGVTIVVLVMIPMNMWLTSVFMNLAVTDFVKGFLGVCVAFNVIKAGSNILLYNILSPKVTKEFNKLLKRM